ncbi:hypothetical protein EDB86DRAFT_3094497 [Lactarius hatsudake]|nr:hypothetical protein EDB86DRAFT_3094497 [Lactarius hatsudake]
MSQNNIYQRVQTVIQREDDHDLWVSNADLCVEMQYARELPDSIPAYATVCRCVPTARSSAIEANTVTILIAIAT